MSPWCKVTQHVEELSPVGSRAGHLLAVNLRAARAAKLRKLAVERLAHGADASVADEAFFGGVYGKRNTLIGLGPKPISRISGSVDNYILNERSCPARKRT
jgi:hypothetical protein